MEFSVNHTRRFFRLLVYSELPGEVNTVLLQPEEQANPAYLEGVHLACAAYAEIINPYNPVPS